MTRYFFSDLQKYAAGQGVVLERAPSFGGYKYEVRAEYDSGSTASCKTLDECATEIYSYAKDQRAWTEAAARIEPLAWAAQAAYDHGDKHAARCIVTACWNWIDHHPGHVADKLWYFLVDLCPWAFADARDPNTCEWTYPTEDTCGYAMVVLLNALSWSPEDSRQNLNFPGGFYTD